MGEFEKRIWSAVSGLTLTKASSKPYAHKMLSDWVSDHIRPGRDFFAPPSAKVSQKMLRGLAKKLDAAKADIQALPPSLRNEIATSMHHKGRALGVGLADPGRVAAMAFLDTLATGLELASEASKRAATSAGKRGAGTFKSAARVSLIADLSAIYHELTGKTPTRAIRNADSGDKGRPYGGFFTFVKAVWPLLPRCRGVSIDEQMKQWAKHRQGALSQSPWLIAWKAAHPYGGKGSASGKKSPSDR